MKNCKWCDKIVSNRDKKFCNTSCSAKFNNRERRRNGTPEKTKFRISTTLKELYRNHPEKFYKFLEAAKTSRKKIPVFKICPACKKEFEITRRPRINCSIECFKIHRARLNCENRGTGWANFGTYKGIKCDSTWELTFLIWAQDTNKNIKRSKLKIQYEFKEKKHLYNPDFEIDDKIYEIKGYVDLTTKLKLEAAKEQGFKIILVCREDIKFYINYVKEKYGKDPTKEYKYFYEQN